MPDEIPPLTPREPPRRVSKARFATWAGWIGGGVFCVLNITTGIVPGGFIGGVLGFLLGYGLVWLIITVIEG